MQVIPKKRSALEIIRNEHRAMAAVIHCFEQVLREVREHSLEPPFDVFELAIRYLADFSDQFHHPKEDDHLFPALINRDPGMRDVIRDLQQQHAEGFRLTRDLQKRLERWKSNPNRAFRQFESAAIDYIEFQRRHIGIEEETVIPAAREKLTAADWSCIDEAFGENDDPIFGANPQAAFNGLFRKIVASAPAPWGLGPREEPKRSTVLSKLPFGRKR